MNGNVAIVEDEQNIRDNVGFALKREGYQVESYPDGHAAWEAFETSLPDLVILDIIMPRMDGLELCRRLRTLSDLSLIHISEPTRLDARSRMPSSA